MRAFTWCTQERYTISLQTQAAPDSLWRTKQSTALDSIPSETTLRSRLQWVKILVCWYALQFWGAYQDLGSAHKVGIKILSNCARQPFGGGPVHETTKLHSPPNQSRDGNRDWVWCYSQVWTGSCYGNSDKKPTKVTVEALPTHWDTPSWWAAHFKLHFIPLHSGARKYARRTSVKYNNILVVRGNG